MKMILIDNEGYPTEEFLDFIKNWTTNSQITIHDLLSMIREAWWSNEWGFKIHRKYKGKIKIEMHTGGWSGNESIIYTIIHNIYLTSFSMKYYMWKTGGHYYFELENI